MEIMRLVVTGPVGAGKSTFIRSVSEIEVVDTDRQTCPPLVMVNATEQASVAQAVIALIQHSMQASLVNTR